MRVEVHLVLEVAEGDAVLGFLVDFGLGVVGAEVALAAVLRLPGASGREVVPAMAGGAGAERAVEVDAADAGIGPGAVVVLGFAIDALADAGDGVEVGRLAVGTGLEVGGGDRAAVGRFEGDHASRGIAGSRR